MTQPRTVAIIGYGTAGQALSILLSRDHHVVHVFERAKAPGPVGAGFLLQPSGLDVLWQMALLPQVLQHGAPVQRLYGETPCGRAVMDMRYAALDAHLHGVGMQRGALFTVLAQAWEHPGNLQADTAIVEVDSEKGRVRDARGQWHGPYDVVIAADGAASTLRAQVAGARHDREYPWGALWCLLPRGDWPHVDELRQRYLMARRMIGLLPVGTRPGDDTPRLSFFWSLPRDRFAHWERDGMARWLDDVAALWPAAHGLLQDVA
ncbi:NAD(P)/FAD-dependent oxidoreductase, partial [Stenotrophomonas sp.]